MAKTDLWLKSIAISQQTDFEIQLRKSLQINFDVLNGKIGLFGGTFDPIHNGHVQICESFLKSGLIDELWIIPASIPPQKENSVIASFSQRIAMLKLAFTAHGSIKVLDIEDNLPKPNYTIQTVRHLKNTYPLNEFKLCIGADSLNNFHTWYEYQKLLLEIDLLVVSRPGINIASNELIDFKKIQFINHIETNISSSEVRRSLNENRHSKNIPVPVLNYIQENKLYVR